MGKKVLPSMTPTAPVGGVNAPVTQDFESPKAILQNSTSQTSARSTSTASDEAYSVRNWAVGLVLGAVLLLWILGGVVFRDANI